LFKEVNHLPKKEEIKRIVETRPEDDEQSDCIISRDEIDFDRAIRLLRERLRVWSCSHSQAFRAPEVLFFQ
jgi:hypothetical protein